MNIVFLDESTLHNGELDLSNLQQLGKLSSYATTSQDQTVERTKSAEIILTNKAVITREIIEKSPKLKLIQSVATGVNQIDLQAASDHDVVVCNVAGYSTQGVAQHVFAMMLNLSTNIHHLNSEIEMWPQSPIFTRLNHPISDLQNKVIGIAGMGNIGAAVARIAKAFGMHVQALARKGSNHSIEADIPRVDAETFFSTSDFISLHCPLNQETTGMINKVTLSMMKPSAFLINTGRGPLIMERDLFDALTNGVIAGAGLDVLTQEPPQEDNPLICSNLPNLIITPHTAWAGAESRQRLLTGIIENIKAYLNNTPINVVT